MEKGRQMEQCERKMEGEGWAGTVVTAHSGDPQVLLRNMTKSCNQNAFAGVVGGVWSSVPWPCSHLYFLLCEEESVPVLWCGRRYVAYLASSPMLLLKQVPAHQALGCSGPPAAG